MFPLLYVVLYTLPISSLNYSFAVVVAVVSFIYLVVFAHFSQPQLPKLRNGNVKWISNVSYRTKLKHQKTVVRLWF